MSLTPQLPIFRRYHENASVQHNSDHLRKMLQMLNFSPEIVMESREMVKEKPWIFFLQNMSDPIICSCIRCKIK